MSMHGGEQSAVSDVMLSKFRQLLTSSICDGYTRHRICKSLKRSQVNLHTMLTAKSLFDKAMRYLPGYIRSIETSVLSDLERFALDRRRREMERTLGNEYLVFIGCTIIASKLYMDFSYTNFSWIEVCHHGVDQINAVERQILLILDYDVDLDWGDLKRMYDELGETSVELAIDHLEVKRRKNFLKWAFGSLFRFISCIDM